MSAETEKWKKLIDKGKSNLAKEQGRIEMLMSRLNNEFKIGSVEELSKEIERIEIELTDKRTKLEGAIDDFRNKYAERLEAAAK